MTALGSATAFHDLDRFLELPRLTGLAISPDGRRLVTSVARLNDDRNAFVTALWEIDPGGERPARRLTRSAKGETGAAFAPDGALYFTSARPDPAAKEPDDKPQLWRLSAGGDAVPVTRRPAGVGGFKVARDSGEVVLSADTLPGSTDEDAEREGRQRRKDLKVNAMLHEGPAVRFWDHDLGPGLPRLLLGRLPDETEHDEPDPGLTLRDLTPDARGALVEASYDVTPDGSTVVTNWSVGEVGGRRHILVAIDVASGERRVLADEPEREFANLATSPDGRRVAVVRYLRTSPTDPGDQQVVVVDLETGEQRQVAAGWDRWPASALRWTPDGTALITTADEDGRSPVFRLEVDSGAVTRLTADDFAYTDVQVSPDGETVYALRSSYLEPHRPVRLDARTPDQSSTPLRGPAEPPELPGTLTEIRTDVGDGVTVRSTLVLPHDASERNPAPLLLWIHGGPLSSWNSWTWRWTPWIAVAQGYAVLLPDPALSTGYGLDFIRRGWGRWGEAPYADLMAATDDAVKRPEIDETRTAAMGGSFGGYMANWVAGHTDRFQAIVTHASLWALDQFGPTTDAPWYWAREMTEEMAEAHSPHRFADEIRTPMLVIHGDKDYRVPIGEGLRLWTDLVRRSTAEDGSVPHKFLYFPDENHWILTPQHAKVWYQTVLAFLAHHVLGEAWETPELLR